MKRTEAEREAERKRWFELLKRRPEFLPERIRGTLRDWILVGIADCIDRWHEVDPKEVERYRERLSQMVEMADDLSAAIAGLGAVIEASSAKLAKIEGAKLAEIEDGAAVEVVFSAESHLRSIITRLRPAITRAADALGPRSFDRGRCQEASWNTLFRPGRGRRLNVSLAASIDILLRGVNRSVRRDGELSNEEMAFRAEPLLDHEIKNVIAWLSGREELPEMSLEAQERRNSRRKAKSKEKKGVGHSPATLE